MRVNTVLTKIGRIASGSSLLAVLLLLLLQTSAAAREIIDMAGNRVQLPEHISRVVGVSPPCTYLLYAIDPSLIAGLHSSPSANEKSFMPASFTRLPIIGGFFGQGHTINKEVLLGVHPDFMLYSAWKNPRSAQKYHGIMAQFTFPKVAVRVDSVTDYPAALRFLGSVVDRAERAEKLAEYAEETLAETREIVSALPENQKVRVYYAEGVGGLSTEPQGSSHAELIPLSGGINVHKGQITSLYGHEQISMEQVLLYNPEVILVQEKRFYDSVFSDPRWQNIQAVRNHRVYLIPRALFNWFDRPPSFMRLLGCKWLLHQLYPQRYQPDMVAETIQFYHLFLGIDLTPKQAEGILNP
jgi:iron complex transport system substrate-binding protein